MKTITANFTAEQEKLHTQLVKKIEILGQFDGEITDRDSATQLKVSGDATGIFSQNDYLTIPLVDYDIDYQISASPTYAGGKTTITITGTLPTTIVGFHVAKKYIIHGGDTDYLVENGISPIRVDTEGETLNSFMADDVKVVVDNSEGYFYNKDASGLFNLHLTAWIRVKLGYKQDTTRLLYFSGIIPREMIHPDKYRKILTFQAMGFMKELERYPGFEISQQSGYFLKLKGINIKSVDVPSGSLPGVFKIKYKFESKGMQGITIKDIDKDTTTGVKSLKFVYPDLFSWDNGALTTLTEDTTGQTLTAKDTTTITVDCTTFDVQSREGIVIVENELKPEVAAEGIPKIQFNKGQWEDLVTDFIRVIRYDGSTYTEETGENNVSGDEYEALDDASDYIYFYSDRPFYGLNIILGESSNLASSTISVMYSKGFDTWASLTVTDGSSNLSQDGTITWTKAAAEGWRPTAQEPSGLDDVQNLYGIRIYISSYGSGAAYFDRVTRRIRLYGTDGRSIDLEHDFTKFGQVDLEEDLIIRQDDSGNWITANWYRNLPINKIVDLCLDKANILSADRNIDTLALTSDDPTIHIFGQAPYPFYGKKVTAGFWDANRQLWWLGIEDELWTFDETEGFEHIDTVPPPTDVLTTVHIISALAMDAANQIHGIGEQKWPKTPATRFNFTFRANTGGITDFYDFFQIYARTGKRQYRNGYYDGADHRTIGYSTLRSSGENLCIPYPQMLSHYPGSENVLYDANGLDTNNITGNGRFYFGTGWPSNPNSGTEYFCPAGHYMLNDNVTGTGDQSNLAFPFELGNPYVVRWDSNNDRWIIWSSLVHDTLAESDIRYVDYQGNEGSMYDIYTNKNIHVNVMAITFDGTYNYLAFMEWSDSGAGTKSPCILYRNLSSLTALFNFSSDSAEAGQSITGREAYQVILDMAINSTENTIHGCLLDRGNFEYHYFVYDITADEMYSIQLTDPHRQMIHFLSHTVDTTEKIYAMVIDRRYQKEGSYLIETTFSGGTITITEKDVIDHSDYDSTFLISGNNKILGNTIGENGVLWSYTESFYPVIQYADFSNMVLREVLTDMAQLVAFVIWINSQRKFNMNKRETYDDTFTFYSEKHLLNEGIQPQGIWKHYYDYIQVNWESILDDSNGDETSGTPGWDRRGLELENRFITDQFLAKAIADENHSYLGTIRESIKQNSIPILELEQRDRFNTVYSERRYDIDRSSYFHIESLHLDLQKLILTIKAIGM